MNGTGHVIVNTFGPTVWISTDTGATFSTADNLGPQDTLCALGNGASGDADAVVAFDGTFYADNLCVPGVGGASNDSFTNQLDGAPDAWNTPANAGGNVDRPWYAAGLGTPGVVYMSFHDLQGPNINVLKSVDFGHTFVCPTTGLISTTCPVTQTLRGNNPNSGYLNTAVGNVTGRPVIDPRYPTRIYLPYADNNAVASTTAPPTNSDFDLTRLRIAVSTNGGVTWSADVDPTGAPVLDANAAFPFDGTNDNVVAHNFPWLAVDRNGNLYLLFSLRLGGATQAHLYLMTSSNLGQNWSTPRQVDQGGTDSNVMAWIAAGVPGSIAISWYGSVANDFNDRNAAWAEMFAQSVNALSATPTFTQSRVSGSNPLHVGDICAAGTFCLVTGGNRNLADFQMIDIDQCGRAHPVYTDDHTGQGVTIAARQTAGQRVLPNPCTH